MQRRELLKMIAVVTGAAVVGGELFLTGCKTADKTGLKFTEKDFSLLNEIGETILPTTPDSQGAKAAQVAEFMEVYVRDCYPKDSRDAFVAGLVTFEEEAKKLNGKGFAESSAEERKALLLKLEEEANKYNHEQWEKDGPRREELRKQNKEFDFVESPRHYYTMFKQLTIMGYFTSEIGQKEALRFNPVPGKYDGAYPYKEGEKAWA